MPAFFWLFIADVKRRTLSIRADRHRQQPEFTDETLLLFVTSVVLLPESSGMELQDRLRLQATEATKWKSG